MNRQFSKFETVLIHELADIANLLVDRLNASREADGLNLSCLAIRQIVETTIRVAAARKRLGRFRRLRSPSRFDEVKLDSVELDRLKLDRIDLDTPFVCEDLKGQPK